VGGAGHSRVAAVLAVAGLAALSGCGSSGGPATADVSGSFVGVVPGTDIYVAVVAAPPAREGQARAVRVYACDGARGAATVSEWFPGRGTDAFALTSDSGRAQVRVTLGSDAARGVLSLADGRRLDFSAPPARGIAGLYEVTILPDGRVRGVSESGTRQSGRVSFRPDASGRYHGRGTYTTADGTRSPWASSTGARLRRGRVIESRVIVLADGSRRGAFKRRTFVVIAGSSQPPN
jgi:hypothetical protein